MKILIADDEPLARARLSALVAELPDTEVVGEAENGRDAVELSADLKPDVVLLDVSMPLLDGLEAARYLSELDPAPAIVFCTAYDEHALKAFELRALDYLVKPIRRERLADALERARRLTSSHVEALSEALGGQRRTHLCARVRGNLRLIPIEEVIYLQADEKYVVVHYTRGQVLVEDALKALEDEFAERFVRIHRNCLVARHRLSGLRRSPDGHVAAELRGCADLLEVSRRNLPALRKLVKHI